MLRWSVLMVSLIVNLPALWAALVEQQIPTEQACFRLLVTVPIVAILLMSVRSAFDAAGRRSAHPADDARDKR